MRRSHGARSTSERRRGWLVASLVAVAALLGHGPEARGASISVRWVDGTVAVRAADAPLISVLTELSRATGLIVEVESPPSRRASLVRPLSVDFDGLSLGEAVARLLRGHNFVIRLAAPGSPDAGRLWVYPAVTAPDGPAASSWVSESRGDERAERLAALMSRLATAERAERIAAVIALNELGRGGRDPGPAGIPAALRSVVRRDADPAVRMEAVFALVGLDDPAAVPTLEQVLVDDPVPAVREAAIEALAATGDGDAAWAIAVALGDGDAALREQAVYALGDIGGEVAIDVLQRALSDDATFVARAAVEVVEELTVDR